MNILLISHQLDYSGAPLALFHLATAMKELGCSLEIASLNDGPLSNDFELIGVPKINYINKKYNLIILNTLLTMHLAEKLYKNSEKIVLWLHESPTFVNYNKYLDLKSINTKYINLIMGVADFQIRFLEEFITDTPCIRFDNTIGKVKNLKSNKKYFLKNIYNCILIGSHERRKGYYKFKKFDVNNIHVTHQIKYNIVGVDKYKFERDFHELNIFQEMVIYEKMSHSEVMSLIQLMDIFISLSEDEVKPLTILESVSQGLPCIVSNIPAHRELEDESSLIICQDNPLEFIHTDEFIKWYQKLNISNEQLEVYSWCKFIERTKHLLENF